MREGHWKTVAPARYHEATASDTLRTASASIVDGYARYGSSLPPEAAEAWHAVKGLVVLAEELVRARGTGEAPDEAAVPDIDQQLMRLRSALREHQAVLQQSGLTLRGLLMKRIWEAM